MNWQADLLEDDGQYIFDGSDEDELDQTELDDNFNLDIQHDIIEAPGKATLSLLTKMSRVEEFSAFQQTLQTFSADTIESVTLGDNQPYPGFQQPESTLALQARLYEESLRARFNTEIAAVYLGSWTLQSLHLDEFEGDCLFYPNMFLDLFHRISYIESLSLNPSDWFNNDLHHKGGHRRIVIHMPSTAIGTLQIHSSSAEICYYKICRKSDTTYHEIHFQNGRRILTKEEFGNVDHTKKDSLNIGDVGYNVN
ncbi:hypothetical protein V8B55DRAFT_1432616 [Mucor lusitanicus]